MSTFRNALLSVTAAVALAASAGTAMAAPCVSGELCLDPNNSNSGAPAVTDLAGNLLGSGTPLTAVPIGTFSTLQSDAVFASNLLVNQDSTGATPATPVVTSAIETGSIQLNNFIPPDTSHLFPSGLGVDYNVYAEFKITAGVEWLNSTTLQIIPGAVTVSIDLIASPGSTGPTLSTPSTPGQYGVQPLPTDFLLGTASFSSFVGITPQGAGGCTNVVDTSCNLASTNFDANLTYTPQPGTTGATGFMVAPFPLMLNVGSAAQTATPETTEYYDVLGNGASCSAAGDTTCVDFVTGLTNGVPNGVATVTYEVPEPATLSLLGASLMGFGVAIRRRRRKSQA
jgi:hypothetical protein